MLSSKDNWIDLDIRYFYPNVGVSSPHVPSRGYAIHRFLAVTLCHASQHIRALFQGFVVRSVRKDWGNDLKYTAVGKCTPSANSASPLLLIVSHLLLPPRRIFGNLSAAFRSILEGPYKFPPRPFDYTNVRLQGVMVRPQMIVESDFGAWKPRNV